MLLEEISYEYNLQNRLETVTTDDQSGTVKVIEYKYNTSGIRVSKHTWTEISEVPQGDDVTVIYLADAYNHTGYAQTLEELTFNMADPVVGTDTPDSVTTYTIGDDVIAQNVDGTSKYLLYDGHGSTRQLTNSAGTVLDSYSYDAYGVMLGTDDTAAANADTSLLYAGERYDSGLSQYYLRARYYDQNTGRFNRMDPFAGSPQDPQSLHKYLYCHANPVNAIDPSGNMFGWVGFNLTTLLVVLAVTAILYFAFYRPIIRPLLLMVNSTPMPQEEIDAAVAQMRRYWPSNAKMMNLANGLTGDVPIYYFRMLPPESYSEGLYFLNRMYANQEAVENQEALAVALILFAEFQHHPCGGGLPEEDAQREFIEVRRQLPDSVRTEYINSLHHGGTQNEY